MVCSEQILKLAVQLLPQKKKIYILVEVPYNLLDYHLSESSASSLIKQCFIFQTLPIVRWHLYGLYIQYTYIYISSSIDSLM